MPPRVSVMTDFSKNAFGVGGQMLLDAEERAFIASCDTVCVITESADGWPGLRLLEPAAAAIEVVNSQALRLCLDSAAMASTKIVLLLIRCSDGQHLIVHGHVAAQSEHDGEKRVRISVASRSWSPELSAGGIDPAIIRALCRS